jgi:hypothetical protein
MDKVAAKGREQMSVPGNANRRILMPVLVANFLTAVEIHLLRPMQLSNGSLVFVLTVALLGCWRKVGWNFVEQLERLKPRMALAAPRAVRMLPAGWTLDSGDEPEFANTAGWLSRRHVATSRFEMDAVPEQEVA